MSSLTLIPGPVAAGKRHTFGNAVFLEIGGDLCCQRGLSGSRTADNKDQSGVEHGVDILCTTLSASASMKAITA